MAIKWYLPEDLADEARRFMSPRFAMHVPSFFAAECGDTIWKKVAQRRELDRDRGREILDEILAYPKQVHDAVGLTSLAYDLAHDVGNAKLAVYDFIYLALAIALDCRMLTADRFLYDPLRATPPLGRRSNVISRDVDAVVTDPPAGILWVADPT